MKRSAISEQTRACLDTSGGKLYTNCGLGFQAELIACESCQQIRLSDTWVSNEDHLEEIIVTAWHAEISSLKQPLSSQTISLINILRDTHQDCTRQSPQEYHACTASNQTATIPRAFRKGQSLRFLTAGQECSICDGTSRVQKTWWGNFEQFPALLACLPDSNYQQWHNGSPMEASAHLHEISLNIIKPSSMNSSRTPRNLRQVVESTAQ